MDDESSVVSQHVSEFVNQLQQSGYDFALGLVRFGVWENGGYPIGEDNGMLTSDINYFINDLWARNYADGSFEPICGIPGCCHTDALETSDPKGNNSDCR